MTLFDKKYTNIYGDGEVAGRSPDAEGDFYHITDAQADHEYLQGTICDVVSSISGNPATEHMILFGGVVTDGGSGTVNVSECVAKGYDSVGNKRMIHIPALTAVALPSGWNDDRQIWAIAKYDFKLGSPTRTHRAGTSYHYQLEDTYLGDASGYDTTSTDDLFVDSDPTGTAIILGSFKMNGSTFTDYGRSANSQFLDQTQGWLNCGEAWAYASADSPTFLATVAGDKRSKYSKGMKFKLEQEQALTGYWTFDSDATSQVGSFTPTNIGTPTYTAGKFGNALTLDGSTDAISLADTALLKPTGDFTIGCWIKRGAVGVTHYFFQSFSANPTNYAGITLSINSSGNVLFFTHNNTGTGTSNYTGVISSNVITDANLHYVVFTFKNNWGQIYIDAKLDASGYLMTPTYGTTNYVRIGCHNSNGTNYDFFNGQLDDLFFINGYALDEETIRAKYESDTAQGTGNIIVTKKFILTDISYSSPNTTLTMYGGTDFALSNGAISNPFYSMVEQPFGFNRNPDKWSVIISSSVLGVQASPASTTLYNLNSLQIIVPKGDWMLYASSEIQFTGSSGGDMKLALSTSNNSITDPLLVESCSGNINGGSSLQPSKIISINIKTTFFLIASVLGSGLTNLYIRSDLAITKIKSTSVYL